MHLSWHVLNLLFGFGLKIAAGQQITFCDLCLLMHMLENFMALKQLFFTSLSCSSAITVSFACLDCAAVVQFHRGILCLCFGIILWVMPYASWM